MENVKVNKPTLLMTVVYNTGGRSGWHGYPIPGTEASPKLLREFFARGDISKAEYNKLIKGK
jgi:uncharacterized membrane protein